MIQKLKRGWCGITYWRPERYFAWSGGAEWRRRRCGSRFAVPWAIQRMAPIYSTTSRISPR